ncbi:MAG: ABC transporter permease [Actinomycetota bacterium]|nr:ABC transporter permease [Actinomycetota bacterium]
MPAIGACCIVFLLTPIAYTVAFSFNDAGRSNLQWRAFTLDNWTNPCGAPRVCSAVGNSLVIGGFSTLIATALGTALAIALVRHRFRMRSALDALIFLPMATPEVVLGASLLAQFLNLRITPGFATVLIAHVMFCISFVVVAVKARVSTLDPRLEEAASDLYSGGTSTFWRITFPLLLPGIASAALLAFAISFDDFIITNFNSGATDTFPKFVYVSATRGIPPQANVIATTMFLITVVIVVGQQVLAAQRRRRVEAASA